MRSALGVILLCVLSSAQAAPVTIDFAEFDLGPGPVESQGFIFSGKDTGGRIGRMTLATNSDKAFGGIYDTVVMEHSTGLQFQLHSLDLGYLAFGLRSQTITPSNGTMLLTGYYAAGGSIAAEFIIFSNTALNAALGTEWAALERVEYRVLTARTDCWWCVTDLEVAIVGNVVASVVPIPAAVWLFVSGLGLQGFLRRKLTT